MEANSTYILCYFAVLCSAQLADCFIYLQESSYR